MAWNNLLDLLLYMSSGCGQMARAEDAPHSPTII